jgi:hypothetical protein
VENVNRSKVAALCSVLVLCACASGPQVKDGWAVRQAAGNPNDQVPLLHKDRSVAGTVEHTQIQIITTVADQVALTSGVGSAVYLVEMSDPAMVNAFAGTDKNGIGYIYITLPMARQLGNDADQWAALLGHEAGHLAKEHQKANASRQATLQGTATALGFIPLPLIGAVARAIAVPIAATAINAHYSRDQEREADALSVQYMVAAGYDSARRYSPPRRGCALWEVVKGVTSSARIPVARSGSRISRLRSSNNPLVLVVAQTQYRISRRGGMNRPMPYLRLSVARPVSSTRTWGTRNHAVEPHRDGLMGTPFANSDSFCSSLHLSKPILTIVCFAAESSGLRTGGIGRRQVMARAACYVGANGSGFSNSKCVARALTSNSSAEQGLEIA